MLLRTTLLAVVFSTLCVSQLRAQGNTRDFERAGPAAERQAYFALVRKEVHEALLRMQDAWVRDDAGKVAAIYTDDASYFPAGSSLLQTRAAIGDYFADFLRGVGEVNVQMLDFGTSGDLAHVTARVTYTLAGASAATRQITRTDMFAFKRRANGMWQIQSHLSREDAPEKQSLP